MAGARFGLNFSLFSEGRWVKTGEPRRFDATNFSRRNSNASVVYRSLSHPEFLRAIFAISRLHGSPDFFADSTFSPGGGSFII